MSPVKDPTLRGLDDCGCCEGIGARTPVEVNNRPGLDMIAYRVGDYPGFKESLLARLSARDLPALSALRTRDDDDFIIALLDAWATAGDVFTFYQERIANEGYLRTATETRSLYQLAELIGYQPRPGVAASTYLAFTLEDADGSPLETSVPVATRVQSIPAPGEKPQVFETVEAMTARPEWNALKPRMTAEQTLSKNMESSLFEGLNTALDVGDSVLIVEDAAGKQWNVQRVVALSTDAESQSTRVDFVDDPPSPPALLFKVLPLATYLVKPTVLNSQIVAVNVMQKSWKGGDLLALSKTQNWPAASLVKNITLQTRKRTLPGRTGVFSLHKQAAVFGHNAPKWASLPAAQRVGEQVTDKSGTKVSVDPVYPDNWDSPLRNLKDEAGGKGYVHLDAVYKGIAVGGWVVLESTSYRELRKVEDVAEVSCAGLGLSGKVTRLTLAGDSNSLSKFSVRDTTVFLAKAEPLTLAELPVEDDVPLVQARNRVQLERPEFQLEAGRTVLLSGERTDLEGVIGSERLTIAEVNVSGGYTELVFSQDLAFSYKRKTVTINANVALATHGEQTEEAIGSGDSGEVFQAFRLRQPPLTHVSANVPSGALSTLSVRVDGLLWQPVPSLYGQGPSDRVYVLRQDSEGESTVQFGDGRSGARLPSGQENVRASYRKGMGEEGLVSADQLSLLLTRPLGVRSVSNPLPASGAQDAEGTDDVRRNAPLPVMTMDRIVSLRDYEDYARAFAGIAKALATVTWDGRVRGVFLTVAGPKGAAVVEGDTTYKNLFASMQGASDPGVPLWVKTYRPAFFRVEGRIAVDSAYRSESVLANAEKALRKQFAFGQRHFGQPVSRSEVIAAIQNAAGVVAVDVDLFYRTDGDPGNDQAELLAKIPEAGDTTPLSAELLTLDPRPLALGVMP